MRGGSTTRETTRRTAQRTITVVLPVDDDEGRARVPAPGVRTADAGSGSIAAIGVVDNGLWRSTPAVLARIEHVLGRRLGERHRFDHLAEDFDAQQRELPAFATRIDGALAVLGN
jgi:hypothetical protein